MTWVKLYCCFPITRLPSDLVPKNKRCKLVIPIPSVDVNFRVLQNSITRSQRRKWTTDLSSSCACCCFHSIFLANPQVGKEPESGFFLRCLSLSSVPLNLGVQVWAGPIRVDGARMPVSGILFRELSKIPRTACLENVPWNPGIWKAAQALWWVGVNFCLLCKAKEKVGEGRGGKGSLRFSCRDWQLCGPGTLNQVQS